MNIEKEPIQSIPPPILIHVERGMTEQRNLRFTETVRIGRDKSCELSLRDSLASRFHLKIFFDGKSWRVFDLGSSNGTFLDGDQIDEALLPKQAMLELGRGGPLLSVIQEGLDPTSIDSSPQSNTNQESVTQIVSHYFNKSSTEPVGEHTMMFRQAFDRTRKKQARGYKAIIGVVALLLVVVAGVAFYQQRKIEQLSALSEEIFYSMKSVEIQIGQIESLVLSKTDVTQKKEMISKRAEFDEMAKRYNDYIAELGIYSSSDLSPEKRVIMRIARIYGECEVNMPDEFVQEVQQYIKKWQSTPRLRKAIYRAEEEGYTGIIRQAFLSNHLPAQFFYLGLQESDFKIESVGPKTRFGIAKGIWQFIPDTARQYGLQTGPLFEEPNFDPKDDRFHFEKATEAAARYLKDIYNGEAQASGLLVMASYNWGHNRIRRLIRGMPENPRDRNFWRLLEHYKIPKETYDYVFYIFSASVIGEDPALFGFDFKNPLIEGD